MARIEDYAIIGDCETAALVEREGSIDWLCLPRFDSEACFARLLGTESNGHWILTPIHPGSAERRYRPGTLILETDFATDKGRVRIIDFMPVNVDGSRIVRIVEGVEGEVEMRAELVVRFDYGITVPWVSRVEDGAISLVAGAHMLLLRTAVPLRGEFDENGRIVFRETWAASPFCTLPSSFASAAAAAADPDVLLQETELFWRKWSGRCNSSAGTSSDAVMRSLITLKALTFRTTGGVVAARRPRFRSRSAVRETGTIAFAGFETRHSLCWR